MMLYLFILDFIPMTSHRFKVLLPFIHLIPFCLLSAFAFP